MYIVPALFVHGRALVHPRKALQIWRKLGAGVLRSSLFLSMYCTLAFAGACIGAGGGLIHCLIAYSFSEAFPADDVRGNANGGGPGWPMA